ncbi:MAG: hypothetical protein ACC652_03425 [Acidimicrobiales bacterium]
MGSMDEWLERNLTTEKVVSLAARLTAAALAYLGAVAGYRNLVNAWQAYPGDYDEILRTVVAGIVAFGFVVICAAVAVARATLFTQMAGLGWFVLVYTATISPWPEHPYTVPNLDALKLLSILGIVTMTASIGVSEYARSKRRKAAKAARYSMPPLAIAEPTTEADTVASQQIGPSL